MTTTVTEPRRDDPVAADTIAQIIRNTQANRITHGSGYTFSRGPGGTSLTIDRPEPAPASVQAAEGGVVVAEIVSGTALDGFDVQCYPNYPEWTNEYSGKLVVMEMALGGDLPVGTLVIAHKIAVTVTGGA